MNCFKQNCQSIVPFIRVQCPPTNSCYQMRYVTSTQEPHIFCDKWKHGPQKCCWFGMVRGVRAPIAVWRERHLGVNPLVIAVILIVERLKCFIRIHSQPSLASGFKSTVLGILRFLGFLLH